MAEQVIVAIFPSRKVLMQALEAIKKLDGVNIQRAAIVARAANGEIVVVDDQLSPNEGGIAGGTLGAGMTALGIAQLGALALPGVGPLIALGAGAMVGALVGGLTGRFAAYLLDFGFRKEQITALASHLETNRPALMLQLNPKLDVLAELRADLVRMGAEIIEADNYVTV